MRVSTLSALILAAISLVLGIFNNSGFLLVNFWLGMALLYQVIADSGER